MVPDDNFLRKSLALMGLRRQSLKFGCIFLLQDSEMEEDVKVLEKANPGRQESLQSENIPDPMEGEQTWPTEEELAEAEGNIKNRNLEFHLLSHFWPYLRLSHDKPVSVGGKMSVWEKPPPNLKALATFSHALAGNKT